jgi:putative glutamine amidotransferase
LNIKRPLIGITPGYDYDAGRLYINNGYVRGVMEAGGLPMIMPVTEDMAILRDIIHLFDGFLISGGPDMDAGYYSEENMPFNGEISPYRDLIETEIIKRAAERNKPVFGICRGIQVINVALGGSLYQDIEAEANGKEVLKHSQKAPKWYPTHDIFIERNSKVWQSFGKDCVRVNSFHHQAVKNLAAGLQVTSRSADGIIESIEHGEHIFLVGVQWHPELMWQRDRSFLKLFELFIKAAAAKEAAN